MNQRLYLWCFSKGFSQQTIQLLLLEQQVDRWIPKVRISHVTWVRVTCSRSSVSIDSGKVHEDIWQFLISNCCVGGEKGLNVLLTSRWPPQDVGVCVCACVCASVFISLFIAYMYLSVCVHSQPFTTYCWNETSLRLPLFMTPLWGSLAGCQTGISSVSSCTGLWVCVCVCDACVAPRQLLLQQAAILLWPAVCLFGSRSLSPHMEVVQLPFVAGPPCQRRAW